MSTILRNAQKAIGRARLAAQSLMVDTVRIDRPTGRTSVDSETGIATPVTETVYEGRAKLQTAGGIAQQSSASATGDTSNIGGVVPVWSLYLHLPFDAANVKLGDLATITDSADPANIGRKLRLINLQSEKTFATSRRWNVSEIPEEATP